AFADADAADREVLADVLTLAGAAAVPGMLEAAVQRASGGVAGTVSRAIARMGADGQKQVAQQVREGRAEQAAMGVEILARVGGEIADEALRHAVRRPEVQVRLAALESAPHLSAPVASNVALTLTDDPEPTVNIRAITCLGELGHDGGIPRLANIALTRGRKADPERRRAAVSALGKIGSEAAIEALVQVIKSGCFFGRRANDEIRLSAVRAVAEIATEEAAVALDDGASGSRGAIAAAAREAASQIRTQEVPGDTPLEVMSAQQGAGAA
ncbi:MAG: HEAT repeat domain-containing protein, partial [Armatimonadota bacterium]